LNTKITSTKVLANGKTELALSDKTTKVVDLYLPALGVTPNSSILPSSWLNERGYVKVDDFLAVKGVSDNTVYAIGDVADIDVDTRVAAGDQAEAAGRVIHALLTDGEPPAKYVKALNAGATVVGRSKAVGHFNGWGIPSIMLWWIKGRYMWTDKLAQLVEFGTYH
jgi:NADH dehydrogenase FAD-containing subunit